MQLTSLNPQTDIGAQCEKLNLTFSSGCYELRPTSRNVTVARWGSTARCYNAGRHSSQATTKQRRLHHAAPLSCGAFPGRETRWLICEASMNGPTRHLKHSGSRAGESNGFEQCKDANCLGSRCSGTFARLRSRPHTQKRSYSSIRFLNKWAEPQSQSHNAACGQECVLRES